MPESLCGPATQSISIQLNRGRKSVPLGTIVIPNSEALAKAEVMDQLLKEIENAVREACNRKTNT